MRFVVSIAAGMSPTIAFAQQSTAPGQGATWFEAIARAINFSGFSWQNLLLVLLGIAVALGAEWLYGFGRRHLGRLNPRSAAKSLGRLNFRRFPGHTLLILGEGGAGKSSLLKGLSHGAAGRSDIKTGKADFATFSMALGVSTSRPRGSGLVISTVDYNGQQPGSVPGLLKQLTSGGRQPVTAVILVLDVVPPPAAADNPVRRVVGAMEDARIDAQIAAWGGNALELIKGDLGGPAPKSFILLINAVDAVDKYAYILREPLRPQDRDEILARFDAFRAHMSKIWRDSSVNAVIGSVNSIDTLDEVRDLLQRDAVAGGAG